MGPAAAGAGQRPEDRLAHRWRERLGTIGARREQSGLFGSVTGAEKIPAGRCLQARRRRDAFWPFGLDQPAARKDARALAA